MNLGYPSLNVHNVSECTQMFPHKIQGRWSFSSDSSEIFYLRNSANDREDPRDCNPMFKRLPAEVVRGSKFAASILSEVRKNMGNFARKQWQRRGC